jgi:hypothetical protein
MSRKLARSSKHHILRRCCHVFPGGRRCRMTTSRNSPDYCRAHAHLKPPYEIPCDVSNILMPKCQVLTTASEVNGVLSNILLLLSRDTISPRRGAVLAYTCNLILRAFDGIEAERQIMLRKMPPKYAWGWRPEDDARLHAQDAANTAARLARERAKEEDHDPSSDA